MNETASRLEGGSLDYRATNRAGWDLLSLLDDPGRPDPETARADLDPFGWISWDTVSSVLCLAGGGGWFAPRFACLGLDVTVFDLSPGQLQRDRQVAEETGLEITYVEGDLLDLSPLEGRRFDLVYQPVSACYVPDLTRMYAGIPGVLNGRGTYLTKQWAPSHLQLAPDLPWDGTAYRLQRPASDADPIVWQSPETWTGERATCVHFLHPLDELVGGICDAGFRIVGFRQPDEGDAAAEPGSDGHVAAFLPPFVWVAAVLGEGLGVHPGNRVVPAEVGE